MQKGGGLAVQFITLVSYIGKESRGEVFSWHNGFSQPKVQAFLFFIFHTPVDTPGPSQVGTIDLPP